MRGAGFKDGWKDRRGYTLPEVLTAVAVAGVLAAISLIIFLALLERWRVEAAADQLAADMRLAHTNATQQLTDWRVVLTHDGRPLKGSRTLGTDPYASRLPEHGRSASRNPDYLSEYPPFARVCHVVGDGPEMRLCCYSGAGVRGEGEVWVEE